MSKISALLSAIVFTLFLFGSNFMTHAQEVEVMTYNIRFDNPGDGEDRWDNRKDLLLNQIKFYEPGIMGTQEGLLHQVDFLDRSLENYEYFGVGRDDGQMKGEFSAVYYDTTRFDLLNHKTFWLSETPQKVSVGWDAALERICTYGLFEHKATGHKFWVFNTHFDHVGDTARQKSAQLIITRIEKINKNGYSVVLMGDFNLEPDSEGIQYLSKHLHDARKYSLVKMGPEGTYNGFDYENPATRRIDYIFVTSDFSVKKYGVLSDPVNRKYPSDHFPVFVTLEFLSKTR